MSAADESVLHGPSPEAQALAAMYADELALFRDPGTPRLSPVQQRAQFDEQMSQVATVADDVVAERTEVGGVPGEWVTVPESSPARVVLYLHGGGYVLGSPPAYRELASRLARAAKARVLVVDYRLAPEHPFPAALDDAVGTYAALLQSGHEPSRVVLAGDSAGGGLAVAALVQIRDSGLALPAGAACLSPWVDLQRDGGAASPFEDLAPEQLEEWSQLYLAGADAGDPLASPVYAALEGLPPTLIHVGGSETLRDDAVRLADALSNAGSAATLRIFDGLVHIFQVVPELPETEDSVGQIGAFILGLTSCPPGRALWRNDVE